MSVVIKLEGLSRSELFQKWQEVFQCPAPSGCHISFIRQALAWQIQARQIGGLTATEHKQLMGDQAKGQSTSNSSVPPAGTVLVRVWQDQTHQVTVSEQGYLYDGKVWRSLSAVARQITGTAWSGPVFFGLKPPANCARKSDNPQLQRVRK